MPSELSRFQMRGTDDTAAAQFQRLHVAMVKFGVGLVHGIGIFWLLDRISAWLNNRSAT